MPKPAQRTVFVCEQCGAESLKWQGRCASCGEWNSLKEAPRKEHGWTGPARGLSAPLQELSSISIQAASRLELPYGELNRVLGGGIVPGSLILMAGDPGIGKSTLLLQIASAVARTGKVLYISGEESPQQVKMRADRLGVGGNGLYFLAETQLEEALAHLDQLSPTLAIVDSVQTLYTQEAPSTPGSVAQVRECTLRLMQWAKGRGTAVFIAGHVTKDGAVAGPRVLEHMVDVVLYLEGESLSSYRLLRGVKNRFGSTNEVGVFRMATQGLEEVQDPSRLFLSQRREGTIGSAIVPVMEGTRPMVVEVQALTSPTIYPAPRRTANGVDFNRLLLVATVLSQRVSVPLGNQDVIVSVAGGLRVEEPGADLGVALALVSSVRKAPLPEDMAFVGEVGLGGEVRAVSQPEGRLKEVGKLGFRRCLLPSVLRSELKDGSLVTPIWVDSLGQAIREVFPRYRRGESVPHTAGALGSSVYAGAGDEFLGSEATE